MSRPDYRGARGANAGDDYHELWALRESLALLDPRTEVAAITLEGVHPDDAGGATPDAWDGVDCGYYYGGDCLAAADRVRLDQVKYSSADPDRAWTVARLTAGSGAERRSVLGRLGQAFEEVRQRRPDLVEGGRVSIRLVSNQPIAPEVTAAVAALCGGDPATTRANGTTSHPGQLAAASRVDPAGRAAFFRALDFSQCGAGSRLAAEAGVLATVAGWTETDARPLFDSLMRAVRLLMMPESTGEAITRHWVLSWLGVSDAAALFPCPSVLERPAFVVAREAARAVARAMRDGRQRVCLHGGGGVGKTTALFEIADLLPAGSEVVAYDCYGGGRYLDAESPRHRPAEAFLQLCNDVAARLQLPLLVRSAGTVAVFAKRLGLAAEAFERGRPGALLVIAADAADNAVFAATHHAPPEAAFVHALAQVGQLPPNVRLLITTRTGRLDSLRLRPDFVRVEILGFSLTETAAYVRHGWPAAPDPWVEDFHALSRGNPRVQTYALRTAGASDPAEALDALRPGGKELDQVFAAQFDEAARKWGSAEEGRDVARGLMALPRPVPVAHLAAVVDRPEAVVRDFCQDLAPGVRLEGDAAGFADEDFEAFVRAEAGDVGPLLGRVADRLTAARGTDPYAALHVAPALFAAGRRRAVVELANADDRLAAVRDPAVRRDIQLQRTRVALRVCRDAGDVPDALLTAAQGAAALKTDAALRKTLADHPALAVRFAEASVSRGVLQRPEAIAEHGRVLFHQLAADATRKDALNVREGWRRIAAWLQQREAARYEASRPRASDAGEAEGGPAGAPAVGTWPIADDDLAAGAEARLRVSGPRAAVEWIRRWRPRYLSVRVALDLAPRLMAGGDAALLARCLEEVDVAPWDVLLRVPLALAGGPFDAGRAEASLAHLLRRGQIRPDERESRWHDRDYGGAYLDTLLTACELCLGAGRRSATLVDVLTRFGAPRRPASTATGDALALDLRLRALGMLAHLGRRSLDPAELFPTRPPLGPEATRQEHAAARDVEEQEQRARELVTPFVPLYDGRARILLGGIDAAERARVVADTLTAAGRTSGRYSHHRDAGGLRTRAAGALLTLLAQPAVDPAAVWAGAETLAAPATPGTPTYSAQEADVWTRAAARPELHATLVARATARADAIRQAQMAAPEQIDALCRLATAVLPFAPADAGAIFHAALDAAEGVDPDVSPRLALLAALAPLSAPGLAADRRRELARQSAVAFEDAAVRLQGYNGFPWGEAFRGLAAWDVSFALAAVGRWDDTQLVSRREVLPEVVRVALGNEVVAPAAALALAPLIGPLPDALRDPIVQRSAGESPVRRARVTDALAEDDLRFGGEGAGDPSAATARAVDDVLDGVEPGPWASRHRELARGAVPAAVETSTLDAAAVDVSAGIALDTAVAAAVAERAGGHAVPVSALEAATMSVRWGEHDLTSAEHVSRIVAHLTRRPPGAKPGDPGVGVAAALETVRARVPVRDRIGYASAILALLGTGAPLTDRSTPALSAYDLSEELGEVLRAWDDSAGVRHWADTALIDAVPAALPALTSALAWGSRVLLDLCRRVGGLGAHRDLRGTPLREALLLGLEQHGEALTPAAIYRVVGLAAELAEPADVARVAEGLAARLVARVAPEHRARWDVGDLPSAWDDAVGRLLYAYLGDPDVRIRWRAAHAVRRLVVWGERATVTAVVASYARRHETLFRDPNAPFYWQAARLWLVVALARAAHEAPNAVAPYARFLVAAGTDAEFPHLLLRSFARDAVSALATAGAAIDDAPAVSPADLAALGAALGVGRPRARRGGRRGELREPDDRDSRGDARRFRFDSLDTVPYWYVPAVRAFADVDMPSFLDAAEHWIVDRWRVEGPVWEWDRETRRARFERFEEYSHSHGSRPLVERYRTHLEWHAMWCAAGALMTTRTLAKGGRFGDADDDALEDWLARAGLGEPPYWLADFREPAPPGKRGLPAARTSDGWLQEVAEADLRAEVGLTPGSTWVTVAAEDAIDGWGGYAATSVHAALVSPATAAALVRALQMVDDAHSFRLPNAGDDFEIRVAGHRLLGLIGRRDHDRGDLDDHDPAARGAAGLVPRLPPEVAAALDVRFALDPFPRWADARTGATVLRYQTWSNAEKASRHRRYEQTVRGWRLQIAADALQRLLTIRRLDLIVEVGVHRRARGYEHSSHDPEAPEDDARFSRLYLLRTGGDLAAAEGPVGTWAPPRP